MEIYKDGQYQEAELEVYKGKTIRKGTYERNIVNEVSSAYSDLELSGRRVLDIGGNIGLFASYALEHAAELVVAVEPEPSNFQLMKKNAPHAHLYEAAAVLHQIEKEIPLYLSVTGKNPGNYSTTEFRGRDTVMVATVAFHDLIRKYTIDTVKMDCEGAEYDLLSEPLPDCVRQISVEVHLNKTNWREIMAPSLVKWMKDWECVREPKIGEKNWHTIGAWKR